MPERLHLPHEGARARVVRQSFRPGNRKRRGYGSRSCSPSSLDTKGGARSGARELTAIRLLTIPLIFKH
nr:MAG TPA: hypothetical protein [Caudoviricetes sp.]